jgi:hypothetical protein
MKLKIWLVAVIGIFGGALLSRAEEAGGTDTVDFRYSPPEWQTLICLPDDPCKSLVDKSGTLLYNYKQGEFGTKISVVAEASEVWQKQDLQSRARQSSAPALRRMAWKLSRWRLR